MRDRYTEFEERGAQVIAIAPDTLENARRYFETNDILDQLLHFSPDLSDDERQQLRRACDADPSVASS